MLLTLCYGSQAIGRTAAISPADATINKIKKSIIDSIKKEKKLPKVAYEDCSKSKGPVNMCKLCKELADMDFSNLDLSGADLSKADFRDTKFIGTNLSGANLSNIKGQASFSKANLTNAKLISARLSGFDFSGTNFSGADLTDVKDINKAILKERGALNVDSIKGIN